jgi:hypothetical protein
MCLWWKTRYTDPASPLTKVTHQGADVVIGLMMFLVRRQKLSDVSSRSKFVEVFLVFLLNTKYDIVILGKSFSGTSTCRVNTSLTGCIALSICRVRASLTRDVIFFWLSSP